MTTRIAATFAGLLLATVLQSSMHASNIQVFSDRTVFVAATGATSATGVLPNVGTVIDASVDPLGTYTLGSLTFALTAGSDNIAVGASGTPAAPDWYPPTAANDIALGFERMQVSTSGLVYSIGFDFVEPDTTVQPWGGSPEESTYEILLFNGPTLVGQAQFEGADVPNDVVTFLGVWSDQAFNRVLINDISGNDDDEYFGEFFTGTIPAPTPGVSGCVQLNGAPMTGRKVIKTQAGVKLTTNTDAGGCYQFPVSSGTKFKVLIQGPVVP